MIIATITYIVICALFVLFSLLQQSESGGMGILGGSSNTLLGSNKASVLTKITSFFAVLFISSALILSILSSGDRSIFDAIPDSSPSNLDSQISNPSENVAVTNDTFNNNLKE